MEKQNKFCPSCGTALNEGETVCKGCGRQFEHEAPQPVPPQYVVPNVVVQTTNVNTNTNTNMNGGGTGIQRNKWVAFFLCLFLGFLGIHKFYEQKAGMGVLYIFTIGLFGIGVIVDLITILFKPTTYYV